MEWTDPRPPMECFSLVIDALLRSIAQRLGFMPQALLMLTVDWVRRRRVRFIALVGRIRAGVLPRVRASRARTDRHPNGCPDLARAKAGPSLRLPRGFAWMCRHVPQWAAGHGAQLACLLTHPEMAALIAADPRVGRLLRPLLLALGVAQLPGVLPPRPDPSPPRTRPPPTRPLAGPRPPSAWSPSAWSPSSSSHSSSPPSSSPPWSSAPLSSAPPVIGALSSAPLSSAGPPDPASARSTLTRTAAAKFAIARAIFGNTS